MIIQRDKFNCRNEIVEHKNIHSSSPVINTEGCSLTSPEVVPPSLERNGLASSFDHFPHLPISPVRTKYPTIPSYEEYEFSSVSASHFQTGATGERAQVVSFGLGYEEVNSVIDPIILNQSAISIKTISGGTITDISTALSISAASLDLTGATVHTQLYSAKHFNAKEFFPVKNAYASFDIPINAPVGSTFTTDLTNLSIKVGPDTQLVFGFYVTSKTANTAWGADAYVSGVVKMKQPKNA